MWLATSPDWFAPATPPWRSLKPAHPLTPDGEIEVPIALPGFPDIRFALIVLAKNDGFRHPVSLGKLGVPQVAWFV